MKSILVLRHAKSSWKFPKLSDSQRPLNKRGKQDAPRMGELLIEENLVPDLIISSPAVRAISTAEAVAEASDYENEIQTAEQLYLGGINSFLNIMQNVPNHFDRVMVVGHNPGVEDYVEILAGEWVKMPTAALVHIELPIDDWADLSGNIGGSIRHVWLPK